MSLPEIVEDISTSKPDLALEELGAIACSIWYARNAFVHFDRSMVREEVIQIGLCLMPLSSHKQSGHHQIVDSTVDSPFESYLQAKLKHYSQVEQRRFGYGFMV